jgi:thiosulfate reductase cytochrome b subunit
MNEIIKPIHPAWLRVTHWLNATAVVLLVMSGWRIYNASPIFNFRFANEFTLGGWLGGEIWSLRAAPAKPFMSTTATNTLIRCSWSKLFLCT